LVTPARMTRAWEKTVSKQDLRACPTHRLKTVTPPELADGRTLGGGRGGNPHSRAARRICWLGQGPKKGGKERSASGVGLGRTRKEVKRQAGKEGAKYRPTKKKHFWGRGGDKQCSKRIRKTHWNFSRKLSRNDGRNAGDPDKGLFEGQ